jgi:hypothetical protein
MSSMNTVRGLASSSPCRMVMLARRAGSKAASLVDLKRFVKVVKGSSTRVHCLAGTVSADPMRRIVGLLSPDVSVICTSGEPSAGKSASE